MKTEGVGNMNTLSDELQEQEYLGYWWLPVKDGQTQDQRAGIIRFKPDRRADLDLLGSFEGRPLDFNVATKQYPVIQGAAHGMKRITIFDGTTSHRDSNLFEPPELAAVRISFIEGWIGEESYTSKEDIRFSSFEAGMDGLSAWHNANAFECKSDFENHNTDLHYKRPVPIGLYKDDLVEIKLGYSWQGASQSLAQCEGSISHDPRIVIKSVSGKLPYYGERGSYHFYLSRIRTILGLMVGRGCPLYDCTGLVTKAEAKGNGEFVREISLRHLWRRDIETPHPISPLDIWIPYINVAGYITKVVQNFIAIDDASAGLAGHLVYMGASGRTKFTQGVLPELVYMFEGLHRDLCDSRSHVHLKDRFEDEFSRIGTAFPFVDLATQDLLIGYVKGCRNAYAHADPDSNQRNYLLYIYATIWMRMFLASMLLEICGMPVADIYRALRKNHEYCLIAAKLSPLLHN